MLRSRLSSVAASLALALVLAVSSADSPSSSIEQLSWLAGSWKGETDGVLAEEHWTAPGGGVMLGTHRDVGPSGKAFFEYLRIEQREDGIFYVASPMGRSPGTSFRLVASEGSRVEFQNPEHDFPQRIVYWLDEAGNLRARVEGRAPDGGTRGGEWVWQPVP